ncbi:MAG: rRNA maturation RNase YbeY [Clostridiales bacterium]|nr:rRNA maturation RNase YbeY [Clostridiales bacterium]
MNILFNDESLIEKTLIDKIYEAAEYCLNEENIISDNIEISVSFVTNEEIKELNTMYRNKNTVTDVLSFPQFENAEQINGDESIICLGDVVISLEKAKEQALDFGHSNEREIIYLIVHSIFHLLGYDHMEEEKAIMREKEEKVMSKIRLERVTI